MLELLCFLTKKKKKNRDLVSNLRREILILKMLSEVWSGEG